MVSMRNSTGSPLFSDLKSDHSRVVRFRPLVKGNEDPGYEGGCMPCMQILISGPKTCAVGIHLSYHQSGSFRSATSRFSIVSPI